MSTPFTASIWSGSLDSPRPHLALSEDLEVDVAVIGAGITGVATALQLARAGKRVAVIEMETVAGGETGNTSGHLTELLDSRYFEIADSFGREGARLVAQASREAIDWVEASDIQCGFERVPGFLYADRDEDVALLERELSHLQSLGMTAQAVNTPIPVPAQRVVRVDGQAVMDAKAFVSGLAAIAVRSNVVFFERTRVVEIKDGEPCELSTDGGHRVKCRDVVVAANVPVSNKLLLHTKLAAYRSYVVAGRSQWPVVGGLYWDMRSPYHYTRTLDTENGLWLVVGGFDHKTGLEEHTEERFADLEHWARSTWNIEAPTHRWSGQIVESADGLPLIGKNSASDHVWVATGYGGNGLTGGVIASRLLADLVLGRESPYTTLFDPTRIKPIAQAKRFFGENVDFPSHLVADTLRAGDVESVDDIEAGRGALVRVRGRLLAVYRDEIQRVHAFSSVCPHMKCRVKWNDAEKSWDCPCHGGRFSATGRVLNGPPVTDLSPVSLEDESVPEGALAREGH